MERHITIGVEVTRAAAVAAGVTTYGSSEYIPTAEQWAAATLAQRTALADQSIPLTLAGAEITWEAILTACDAQIAEQAERRERNIQEALDEEDTWYTGPERREARLPYGMKCCCADPRIQARLAEAEAIAAANRDAYITGLLDGSVPWPSDAYFRPARVGFVGHERSDDLENEYLRRYHENEAEVIARREQAAQAKEELEAAIAAELKEWAATSGDEDLELAAAEDYNVVRGVAWVLVKRIIDAVGHEPEAVLVVGTTREDKSTWDERPSPRAKAIREQKRIEAVCDELPVLPKRTEIEVSRVMRAAIAPELTREQRNEDDDGGGPNKLTACIVTIRHPALATRHLVFALE